MIDRPQRDALADLVHSLIVGAITNFEFEDHLAAAIRTADEQQDAAIAALRHRVWYIYSDVPEYRMIGPKRFPRDARAEVLRWILFLRSDVEYRWPSNAFVEPTILDWLPTLRWLNKLPGVIELLLSLPFILLLIPLLIVDQTLRGLWRLVTRRSWFDREHERLAPLGDVSAWPFLTREEYETAAQAACPFETIRVQAARSNA